MQNAAETETLFLMVITRFVEVCKIKTEKYINKSLDYHNIKGKLDKNMKKVVDNLLNTNYNGAKQIVELFNDLAEFRNRFSNAGKCQEICFKRIFRHWI